MSEYIDTSTIDSMALTLQEVSNDPNNVDIYESMYNQLLMEARDTLWGGLYCAPEFAITLRNPESVYPNHIFNSTEASFVGRFIDTKTCDFTFAAERAGVKCPKKLIAPGFIFEIISDYDELIEGNLGVITIAGSYAALLPGALNFIKRISL